MLQVDNRTLTVSELKTYLNSLEQEKTNEIANAVRDYKIMCNANNEKIRKREILKIERRVEKKYLLKFKARDEILSLLDECKEIPKNVQKLEIAEYMIYRVDMRRTEKIISKVAKRLERRFETLQEEIDKRINAFEALESLQSIDYSEYQVSEDTVEKTKEKYRLEYTEEQRNKLIAKELEIIQKVKEINLAPMPHEILKNSDKEIQANMQKFNNIRQKRIRILSGMEEDYKKLIDPRELLSITDEAILYIKNVQDILTKAEYTSVKNALLKRRKKIYKNSKDIRYAISTKEKKTGIDNFNIQEARYIRMQDLRNIITEATALIKQNPIEEVEKQLEKLKQAYQREKQYAYVIEKLNNEANGDPTIEVRAYEEQIKILEAKLSNSKKIVKESNERIKTSKQELLVLWKMEMNMAINKRKDFLELPEKSEEKELKPNISFGLNAFNKLKKTSKGKHAMD